MSHNEKETEKVLFDQKCLCFLFGIASLANVVANQRTWAYVSSNLAALSLKVPKEGRLRGEREKENEEE